MNRVVRLLAVLAVILFCLHAFSDNKAELDLWGNVGFVKSFPWDADFKYTNTFSFTEPDRAWINHEWLSEYILHYIFVHFASFGLLLYKILVGMILTGILYLSMKGRRVSGVVAFFWIILAISTIGYGFSTRPHLLTYILYAVFLFILCLYKIYNSRYVYLLPVLGILWANLHGAFFIGAVLLSIFLICEIFGSNPSRKRILTLAVVTVLFFAATLVNPYGWRLWKFIIYSAAIARPYLSEWAPFVRIEYLLEHIDFVMLGLISFFSVAFSRKAKNRTELVILASSFAGAISMRRNIPLFAITAAFVVPKYIDDAAGQSLKRMLTKCRPVITAIVLFMFAGISLLYALRFDKTDFTRIEISQRSFPVGAFLFMKENKISGNAIVFFNWAEYSIWKTYPDCRVFLDGRLCSSYSVKTINDYLDFIYLRDGWYKALKNYPTDIVLIHKGNPVYSKMLLDSDWFIAFNDNISALFLKKAGHEVFLSRVEKGEIRHPIIGTHEYFP